MKKIKGFTLVELIIVMAIFAILMAALVNMMVPIRRTYVDSTLYEAQRNTQNGITQYLAESVRYASDIGIYTKDASVSYSVDGIAVNRNVTSIDDAVKYFLKDVSGETAANSDSTLTANAQSISAALAPHVHIITIDHTKNTYTYNGTDVKGRLFRKDGSGASGTGLGRMVLGAAYYGEHDFIINLDSDFENSPNIKFTVTSTPDSTIMNDVDVTTESEVVLNNIKLSNSVIEKFANEKVFTVVPKPDISGLKLTTPHYDDNLYQPYNPSDENKYTETYIIYTTYDDLFQTP